MLHVVVGICMPVGMTWPVPIGFLVPLLCAGALVTVLLVCSDLRLISLSTLWVYTCHPSLCKCES